MHSYRTLLEAILQHPLIDRTIGRTLGSRHVHDFVAHRKEGLGRLSFGQKVGQVVHSVGVRDFDMEVFDALAATRSVGTRRYSGPSFNSSWVGSRWPF